MLQFSIESTDRLATVYVAGSISLPGIWQILDRCDRLPPEIRSLRVDLQAVGLIQNGVLEALTVGLRQWRDSRDGTTRMDLPAGGLGARIQDVSHRERVARPSP